VIEPRYEGPAEAEVVTAVETGSPSVRGGTVVTGIDVVTAVIEMIEDAGLAKTVLVLEITTEDEVTALEVAAVIAGIETVPEHLLHTATSTQRRLGNKLKSKSVSKKLKITSLHSKMPGRKAYQFQDGRIAESTPE